MGKRKGSARTEAASAATRGKKKQPTETAEPTEPEATGMGETSTALSERALDSSFGSSAPPQPHFEPRWPIGAKLRLRPALDASATARIGPAEPRTRARKASATARLTPRTRARSASDIGNSDPV